MRDAHAKEAILTLNFYRDWLAKREKQMETEKGKPTFFVTISREFGCEGFELADKLVERINLAGVDAPWSLFTRKMIEDMAAGEEMESSDEVHEVSEKRWTFKDWFVDALVPRYLQSPSSKVFLRMRNIIMNLVDKGNCVILGAGSQIITQRLDPRKFFGLHVRIVGSYDWRLKRVEHHFHLTRDEAENMLRSRQDSRDKFIADFTGLNANDAALYNLIFNNARNSPDVMADTVLEYLKFNGALDIK